MMINLHRVGTDFMVHVGGGSDIWIDSKAIYSVEKAVASEWTLRLSEGKHVCLAHVPEASELMADAATVRVRDYEHRFRSGDDEWLGAYPVLTTWLVANTSVPSQLAGCQATGAGSTGRYQTIRTTTSEI